MPMQFVTLVPNMVKFDEQVESEEQPNAAELTHQNSFILVSARSRLMRTRIICKAKSWSSFSILIKRSLEITARVVAPIA